MVLMDYEKRRNMRLKENEAKMQELRMRNLACSLLSNDGRAVGNKNKSGVSEDEGSESEYDPCLDGNESDEDDIELEEDGVGEEMPEQETCKCTRSRVKDSPMAPGSRSNTKSLTSNLNVKQSSLARCTRSNPSSLHSPQVVAVNLPSLLNTSPGGQSSRQSNDVSEEISVINATNTQIDDNSSEVAAQVHSHVNDGTPPKKRDVRKKTMGHGLEKLCERRGTKLAIYVPEGKLRPEHPLQAAKLASECGVALRDHLPIYPHWKDYKKHDEEDSKTETIDGSTVQRDKIGHISKVLGVVAARLNVDVHRNGPSKDACEDIIKRGVRQQRYLLKKRYFDGHSKEQLLSRDPPPNIKKADWEKLVEKWSDPRHKRTCEKNKGNRGQVKLHQRTGSRSYIAHRHSLKGKYNNRDPDPIEFFGECMTSSKKDCSEFAKEVIDKMEFERHREPEEGEEPKSPRRIAANTLTQVSRTSQFLLNMGLPVPSKKYSAITSAATLLEAEREESTRVQQELHERVASQEAALSSNQTILESTQQEVREMKARLEQNDLILGRLMAERDRQASNLAGTANSP